MLLQSPIYHGLATHDEKMIAAAKSFAAERNIDRDHFEFQMLFGVRRDLQRKLVAEGYKVRVYVPFGTRMVSLLHAPAGRTPRQRLLHREADVPAIIERGVRFIRAGCEPVGPARRCTQPSAVPGSIVVETSAMMFAGKPPSWACSLINPSLEER